MDDSHHPIEALTSDGRKLTIVLERPLGSGAEATVSKAYVYETGSFINIPASVKVFNEPRLVPVAESTRSIQGELSVAEQVQSPFIRRANGIWTPATFYVLYANPAQIDLQKFADDIHSSLLGLTLLQKVSLLLQLGSSVATMLFRGLKAMHEGANLAHMDVKPKNIFISTSALDPGLKSALFHLGDHSFVVKLGANEFVSLTAGRGTAGYVAPEVFFHRSASRYADLYSAGISLWYLFSGKVPSLAEIEYITKPRATESMFEGDSSLHLADSECVMAFLSLPECWQMLLKQILNRLEPCARGSASSILSAFSETALLKSSLEDVDVLRKFDEECKLLVSTIQSRCQSESWTFRAPPAHTVATNPFTAFDSSFLSSSNILPDAVDIDHDHNHGHTNIPPRQDKLAPTKSLRAMVCKTLEQWGHFDPRPVKVTSSPEEVMKTTRADLFKILKVSNTPPFSERDSFIQTKGAAIFQAMQQLFDSSPTEAASIHSVAKFTKSNNKKAATPTIRDRILHLAFVQMLSDHNLLLFPIRSDGLITEPTIGESAQT